MCVVIAAILQATVAIAVGHVAATIAIRVVRSTKRRVAVQRGMVRGRATTRRTAG